LYVCGNFIETNSSIPTNRLVRWDGNRWCAAKGAFNGNIVDIAFLNDTLFVGGGFTQNGADTLNYFAKWTGPLDSLFDTCSAVVDQYIVDSFLGEEEIETDDNKKFSVYPNPAHDNVSVHNPFESAVCEVWCIDGTLKRKKTLENGRNCIDLSVLCAGIYIMRLINHHEYEVHKLVVK
jgi:hypothetical protein